MKPRRIYRSRCMQPDGTAPWRDGRHGHKYLAVTRSTGSRQAPKGARSTKVRGFGRRNEAHNAAVQDWSI